MTWLGIPYKLNDSNFLDTGILSLAKLPTIVVDSGFGWDVVFASILGAIFGAAIPGIISYRAMSNSTIAMKAERIAQADSAKNQLRAQLLSSSRQQWINTLRDSAASYLSVANKLNNLQILITNEFQKNKQENNTYYLKLLEEETNVKSELTFLKVKIEMLLNPKEVSSNTVITELTKLSKIANDFSPGNVHDVNQIMEIFKRIKDNIQLICKAEWIKIKNFEE
ncbi:hypothetical protein [Proteus genomosp. 4]|uniref:hypothetical protein n=1 Tax=Proteus genomosp. 4 TaxID=1311818 RepID=UPI001FC907E3|nr:hypothetical protein [Proteus genomosp. 4]